METLNRKLRIGVFGGARGRTMIDVLLNHPDAELVAVCDKYTPILDSAKAAAEEKAMANTRLLEEIRDLLKNRA
jgi:predicted dehydrogenase